MHQRNFSGSKLDVAVHRLKVRQWSCVKVGSVLYKYNNLLCVDRNEKNEDKHFSRSSRCWSTCSVLKTRPCMWPRGSFFVCHPSSSYIRSVMAKNLFFNPPPVAAIPQESGLWPAGGKQEQNANQGLRQATGHVESNQRMQLYVILGDVSDFRRHEV